MRAAGLLAASIAMLSLAGCRFEGSSTFGRNGGEVGFTILSTSPTSGEIEVDRATSITVTFSEAISPASLGSASILVETGAIDVDGIVAVDGNVLTFEPEMNLRYFSPHEVTVSGMTSVEGEPLSPYTWAFETRDNRWGDSLVLSTSMAETPNPAVAVDGFGNGLAVWHSVGAVRSDATASVYSPGGWNSPQVIDSLDSNASYPKVAVDESGAGYVVWKQDAGSVSDLWVRARAANGTWSSPQLVEVVIGNVHGFAISTAPNAGARIAWSQNNGATNEIFSRTISPAGSLGLVESVAASGSNADGDSVAVGIAPDGSSICSFTSYDGTRRNLFASRFVQGVGWGASQPLETATQSVGVLDVAFALDGTALTFWLLDSTPSPQRTLWSSRFTSTNGWDAPERVDTDPFGATVFDGRVVFLPDGDAIATWLQGSGTTFRDVIWNRRAPGVPGWQTPQKLTSSNGVARSIDLATDERGNGVVLFSLNIGGFEILQTARWLEKTWGPLAEFAGEIGDGSVDVALSPVGDGLAVWSTNTSGASAFVVSRGFR